MYKLETPLTNFRFGQKVNQGLVPITWYVIEANGGDEDGRCFTYAELTAFQNFINSRPDNFPTGGKNYHPCLDEELTPDCGLLFSIPNPNATWPSNVILRKKPQLSSANNITACMDILLCDTNGTANHTYNLDFDVVGRIDV